ncbi:twinfilin [Anaeramoeba flamelloides]|uniref:Twinfilin n=1 Tax=Anaeramoeba flamelloides TaxID=1746091 RepID=A0ABQ8YVQ5_9EUKA|nr:twinfilin [Anaeramoeba flamelloides]
MIKKLLQLQILSGIFCTLDLIQEFGNARKEGKVRAFKLEIIEEQIVSTAKFDVQGNEVEDFEKIKDFMEPKKGCYVLYRLDSQNKQFGFEWAFFSYVGEGSKVKDRMLYASSKDNCRKKLGYTYFITNLYGTDADEFTFEMIKEARKPSSSKEETLQLLTENEKIQREEKFMEVAKGSQTEYVHGVAFPCSTDLMEKFKNLVSGQVNLVQVALNVQKETLELDSAETIDSVDNVVRNLNNDHPRYVFWNYKYIKDNESKNSLIFFYVCPDIAPIKEKMLYSTVKSAALTQAKQVGVEPEKKLEVRDLNDLTEEWLKNELHPVKKETNVRRFTKPKRAGRGSRRLIRSKK